jgi:putative phosphoribosyl transferase
LFLNRKQAGYLLAEELEKRDLHFDLVLGIPRGGVVPADIIARFFNKELDIILSRKMGSPGLDEPVIGAVAPDGKVVIPEQMQAFFPIDEDIYQKSVEETKNELVRQTRRYRGNRPPLSLEGCAVLLVDDGIATGSTIAASVDYLKRAGTASITIATPVCARTAYDYLINQVDHMVVLEIPENFLAVGQYYQDFTAVEDEEITGIMSRCHLENIR